MIFQYRVGDERNAESALGIADRRHELIELKRYVGGDFRLLEYSQSAVDATSGAICSFHELDMLPCNSIYCRKRQFDMFAMRTLTRKQKALISQSFLFLTNYLTVAIIISFA